MDKDITSEKELREILAPSLSDMRKRVGLRRECGILEDHDFFDNGYEKMMEASKIMGINKGYLTAKTNEESDEVYTPAYAVKPILKYLDRGNKPSYTIWCPFDQEDSEYVIQLRAAGHKVIATHIDNGQNFFFYEPKEPYDYIISNPPFSIKDDILKRLSEIGKPYAMLLPLPTLQGLKRFPYIKDCQALIFNRRINFFKNKETKEILKGVSFASIYICKDFLPQDLIFEELKI